MTWFEADRGTGYGSLVVNPLTDETSVGEPARASVAKVNSGSSVSSRFNAT